MASLLDLKKRVGHGGMQTPRIKFTRVRSTGMDPSKAIREAARVQPSPEDVLPNHAVGEWELSRSGVVLLVTAP